MLLFAASDKGGTGRSVTSANLAFQRSLSGEDVCYLDFDFGSPTAAAVFDVPSLNNGTEDAGLHSYLRGVATEPQRIDIWAETEHEILRDRPTGSGNLILLPGDRSGGEFALGKDTVDRCVDLFLRLNGEFDLVLVDLSAGRSYAVDMALEATSRRELQEVRARWLVYHRWTRQHVMAAAGLVFGDRGIIAGGVSRGHDEEKLSDSIRFVRAAVPDTESPPWSLVPAPQSSWMRQCDQDLEASAAARGAGFSNCLGAVPFEPVLQWREQLITDEEALSSKIANMETLIALKELAFRLDDEEAWERT